MIRQTLPSRLSILATISGLAMAPALLLGQDSLQVTFVGDRELEIREVTKPPAPSGWTSASTSPPFVCRGQGHVSRHEDGTLPHGRRMDTPFHASMRGTQVGFGMYPRLWPTSASVTEPERRLGRALLTALCRLCRGAGQCRCR